MSSTDMIDFVQYLFTRGERLLKAMKKNPLKQKAEELLC